MALGPSSTVASSLAAKRRLEAREAVKALTEFFTLHGLPEHSAEALTDVSHVRRRERGQPMTLQLGRFSSFLIDGRLSERVEPGKVRLWRELMLFEEISRATQLNLPYYSEKPDHLSARRTGSTMCLSNCIFVEVPTTKLINLVTSDPAIAMMLARMATKRHMLTEHLYTATRATPIARIAAVLDYLTEPTRRNQIKRRADGALVMTTTEELVASGPSQADIADALCLGRATVEKAVSELRHLKALKSFGPGERTNRCYPVEDRALLTQIARGG